MAPIYKSVKTIGSELLSLSHMKIAAINYLVLFINLVTISFFNCIAYYILLFLSLTFYRKMFLGKPGLPIYFEI